MSKKQKLPQFVSPAGVAKWPWITKADTKYNADGVYRVKLALSGDAAEGLKKQIEQAAKQALAEEVKKAPKKKNFKLYLPFQEEQDEQGDPTGNTEFSFKSKAVIRMEGKEPWVKKIAVFDSQRKPLEGVQVGNGSTLKVRFEMVPIMVAKDRTAGVSLRFDAVQVIDLKTFSGSSDASGFEEEEGYVGCTDSGSEEDFEKTGGVVEPREGDETGDSGGDF